jgi:hypothetical protein
MFHIITFINLLGHLMEKPSQIDHILIERQQHSYIDVQSFRTADCDIAHYMVAAKVSETNSK